MIDKLVRKSQLLVTHAIFVVIDDQIAENLDRGVRHQERLVKHGVGVSDLHVIDATSLIAQKREIGDTVIFPVETINQGEMTWNAVAVPIHYVVGSEVGVAVVIGAHVNEIENAFARFPNAEISIRALNGASSP